MVQHQMKQSRQNNDVKKVIDVGHNFTYKQLKSWDLKFHELKMGKPEFDIIIDDKAYNYNKSWTNDVQVGKVNFLGIIKGRAVFI